ncbi:hypothetical protein B0H12DRAFT_289956 [Mycena haematopus]|nr:hypothetical protein B0H12DRAFT_289956 [Mycena haematopus]
MWPRRIILIFFFDYYDRQAHSFRTPAHLSISDQCHSLVILAFPDFRLLVSSYFRLSCTTCTSRYLSYLDHASTSIDRHHTSSILHGALILYIWDVGAVVPLFGSSFSLPLSLASLYCVPDGLFCIARGEPVFLEAVGPRYNKNTLTRIAAPLHSHHQSIIPTPQNENDPARCLFCLLYDEGGVTKPNLRREESRNQNA